MLQSFALNSSFNQICEVLFGALNFWKRNIFLAHPVDFKWSKIKVDGKKPTFRGHFSSALTLRDSHGCLHFLRLAPYARALVLCRALLEVASELSVSIFLLQGHHICQRDQTIYGKFKLEIICLDYMNEFQAIVLWRVGVSKMHVEDLIELESFYI